MREAGRGKGIEEEEEKREEGSCSPRLDHHPRVGEPPGSTGFWSTFWIQSIFDSWQALLPGGGRRPLLVTAAQVPHRSCRRSWRWCARRWAPPSRRSSGPGTATGPVPGSPAGPRATGGRCCRTGTSWPSCSGSGCLHGEGVGVGVRGRG